MSRVLKVSLSTILIAGTLISAPLGTAPSKTPEAELSLQVVGNGYRGDPRMTLGELDRTGIIIGNEKSHFHVVLTNRSEQTLRLWEEWNSWGYYNLSFELIDQDGNSLGAIKKIPRGWRSNFPSYLVLEPGQHHVIDVYMNPELWQIPEEVTSKGSAPRYYGLKVKYSIESDADTKKDGVWTGVLESESIKITLGYWSKRTK